MPVFGIGVPVIDTSQGVSRGSRVSRGVNYWKILIKKFRTDINLFSMQKPSSFIYLNLTMKNVSQPPVNDTPCQLLVHSLINDPVSDITY